MTDKEQQDKIFTETKSPFKQGQPVKHKSNPEFRMTIKDFAINKWDGEHGLYNHRFKNPEYPICEFFNVHTKQWEERIFHYLTLEPDNDSNLD